MKVVILAGGLGTRLAPMTTVLPKPMVEIGDMPILIHIMRWYAKFGFDEFVIALGFKGDVIKRYMVDRGSLGGHVKVDFKTGAVESHGSPGIDWRVELVDTGLEAKTGARLRKLRHCLDGTFMLSYGDGIADIDIKALLNFHRRHGRLATLTAVRPLARFGHLECEGDRVRRFNEKPQLGEGWINGGFFVIEPEVLETIPEGEDVSLEIDVLGRLAAQGELMAFRHTTFWHCMDTVRDLNVLETMWRSGEAPWA